MKVAIKVSSFHLLYSIIKRTLLRSHFYTSSSSSSIVFCLLSQKGVQKAWKREKCLLHIKFPLYYLYSECLSRLVLLHRIHTHFLSPSIDETWFEYISRDLFLTYIHFISWSSSSPNSTTNLINAVYHLLTYTPTNTQKRELRKKKISTENEFKASVWREKKCLMAPLSNPKEIRKRYRRLIYCTLRWEFLRCDITFVLNMKAHEK